MTYHQSLPSAKKLNNCKAVKTAKTRADDKETGGFIPRQIELAPFQKGKHSLHHTEW